MQQAKRKPQPVQQQLRAEEEPQKKGERAGRKSQQHAQPLRQRERRADAETAKDPAPVQPVGRQQVHQAEQEAHLPHAAHRRSAPEPERQPEQKARRGSGGGTQELFPGLRRRAGAVEAGAGGIQPEAPRDAPLAQDHRQMSQLMDGGGRERRAEGFPAAEEAGEGEDQQRPAADLQAKGRSAPEGGLFV